MPERNADEIQRDIQQARASLAVAVDQLAYRTSPKRVANNVKSRCSRRPRRPQGQAVIAGVGVVVLVLVVRRFRR